MSGRSQSVEFHEVDRDTLDDFVELFESRGGPKNCWCMVWRATPVEARTRDRAVRKAAIIGRVQRGVPVGILGYIDGKPVAWCSIAPRSTFRGLGGLVEGPGENVWSLTCFFVRREHRGKGMTSRLIQAAVGHAQRGGATVV